MSAPHRFPLADTGFSVWREALLRTTGFDARGLHRFSEPECAAAADADRADFGDLFRAAQARATAVACDIAAAPLFREAVTWQNTNALTALDGLIRRGPDQPRTVKRRMREEVIARYWQRYCAKNDTVGFFGPICWVRVDPDQVEAVTLTPGPGLVRRRRTYLEFWAVAELARQLSEDPDIRPWCPAALWPQLALDTTGAAAVIRRPALPPVPVSAVEAAALAGCDAGRPAISIIDDLVAAGTLRRRDDGLLMFERLVERGLLRWGLDVPMDPNAEAVLVRQLRAIGDAEIRERAVSALGRLQAARDAIARCGGDPDALREALAALDAEFTDVTGAAPRRREGQTYAGRSLCYEETVRDLDATFGAPILDAIAGPLALLLRAARWLAATLGSEYQNRLEELYRELRADGEPVWLGDLWYLAQGMLFGTERRPVDAVVEEFVRRWSALFGLEHAGASSRLEFDSKQLADAVDAAFPATPAGWSLGRMHSPDLQICASDAAAINRGEFTLVLSELHAGWPTIDCVLFTGEHPDVASLREALRADLGSGRVRLLYPSSWPRFTGRTTNGLDHPGDRLLGFAPAPGADPARLLRVSSVQVREVDGRPLAVSGDGASWPLVEMFAWLIATHAVDAFKVTATTAHTPRITVDRLVLARETWRTTVAETGLANVVGDEARYRAVRSWRRRLGLPERIFVRLGGEVKPVFIDCTSPTFASMLCSLIRGAVGRDGAQESVSISEMLPDTDQAWLRDSAGNRYVSELRLQMFDGLGPAPEGT